MNQIVWILISIYVIVVVYIFFISMNIADFFDLKDISLPDNNISKKIRKHITLILLMLFASSIYLYYYNQTEPISVGKILVILGFVVYCYIPYRFALDLIALTEEAISMGSDMERHDLKQTKMHQKTQGLVETNYSEIKLKNGLLYKKLKNNIITKEEGQNILHTIVSNNEKMAVSIDSEKNLLIQKVIGIQKELNSLGNLISDTTDDLSSSISTIQGYTRNNDLNNKKYIQKLKSLQLSDNNQLSSIKELSNIINRIFTILTTKNTYLFEENKISKIFKSQSGALEFIKSNDDFFDYDKENFIAFLTANLTSNAGIKYLKPNSRNNGLDKTYFLNTLLPQMFSIDFAKITSKELQDFISSNFIEVDKEYISINQSQITHISLVIGLKTLNNFIKNNKGI